MPRIPAHRIQRDDDAPTAVASPASARILRAVMGDPTEPVRPGQRIVRRGRALEAEDRILTLNTTARPSVEPSPEADIQPEEPSPADLEREALRESLTAELEAEWSAKVEAARREGFAAGEQAAGHALTETTREAARDLDETAERLELAWQRMLRRSEPLVAELAFRLAEGILEAPLPDGLRTVSIRALSEALEGLGDHAPTEIRIHPVDLMKLEESGISRQLTESHASLRLIGDDTLRPGDWEARNPEAVIRRVGEDMLRDLRDRMQIGRPLSS